MLDDDEDEAPFVCHGCIAEAVLTAEIQNTGRIRTCSYCGNEDRACVPIDWLADRVDPIFREVVGVADEVPHLTSSDNVHWIPEGSGPGEIMADLIRCDDSIIADAIIENLGEKHGYDIFDGDFDYYDLAEEIYDLRIPADPRCRNAWSAFCYSLKHARRFFSEDATELLDEILGPVLGGEQSQFGVAVRVIGPDSPDRFIYRARLANDDIARKGIYAQPIKQLGPPPMAACTAGRMNVAGIPVFYGSFDLPTCVAEIRVPVGGGAVVGKFEIIRPLRLLDLTQLEKVQNGLSYFHPDFLRAHGYGHFVGGFHDEIKKPVIPGKEALDYLPTQMVAEYLWTRGERSVDGIIFGSSQVSGEHANIVLFPDSCLIEGADREAPDTIESAHIYSGHPDDDEPLIETVAVWATTAESSAIGERTKAGILDDRNSLLKVMPSIPPPTFPPLPALRYCCQLIRAQVKAISYDVEEIPVEFRTYNSNPPF